MNRLFVNTEIHQSYLHSFFVLVCILVRDCGCAVFYARRFLYWIQHVLFKKHSILGADFLGVAAYLRK